MLHGKIGVVYGVTNAKSLGFAIAKAWHGAGARIAISVQSSRFRPGVQKLIEETFVDYSLNVQLLECDVHYEDQIQDSMMQIRHMYGERLDMLAHSVAYAPKEALQSVVNASREDFKVTFDTSVYSYIALARAARDLMSMNGGSILSLSFDASRCVLPGYGLMGPAKGALESVNRYLAYELGPHNIRTNVISAGPLNTVSARGIRNFYEFKTRAECRAPLKRPLEHSDIGSLAVFLASDNAKAITGQTIFVDCGSNVMKT